MKKYIAYAMIAALTVSAFTGCGTKDTDGKTPTNTTGSSSTDEGGIYRYADTASRVTLGQYTGVEVEAEAIEEVTDATVEEYLKSIVESAGYVKDENATEVKADSIVNVDYVGSKDGVAFEGGSAKNVNLDVAGNGDTSGTTYIDGFTAGLAGAKVGTEVAYEVTFPENYGKEELNGQTVIFTFTVNYVCKTVSYDELTDEIVTELFDATGVEDLKSKVRSILESSATSSREDGIRDSLMEKIKEGCTVECPEDVIYSRLDLICQQTEATYGMGMEEFSQMYAGCTYEEYAVTLKNKIKHSLEEELIYRAIFEKESLEFVQSEYDEYLNNMLSSYQAYGISTAEDLYTAMKASEKEDGEEFVKNMYMCNKALEFCLDKAVIKDAESKAN